MSRRVAGYEQMVPLICMLPIGQHYDAYADNELRMQASSQEQVKQLRNCFPGTIWKKTYNKGLSWWEYDTELDGIKINIYAVSEGPKTCKAITEKKMVEEKIPTAWITTMVEKEVIIGYDCGDNGDKVDPEPEEDVVVESPTESH